jgi:sec-independent protein translocase protein TatB
MFNVTGGEVIIVLVLALVVLGPEKLPEMLRKAGKLYGELRRMTSGFQSEFEETFAEPLREFRETANQARDMAKHPMDGFKQDDPATSKDGDETPALAELPVAVGSEPPYSPVVGPDTPAVDASVVTTAPAVLPVPAGVLAPPVAQAPLLPPPVAPLWTQPAADKRMDPWATEKTVN